MHVDFGRQRAVDRSNSRGVVELCVVWADVADCTIVVGVGNRGSNALAANHADVISAGRWVDGRVKTDSGCKAIAGSRQQRTADGLEVCGQDFGSTAGFGAVHHFDWQIRAGNAVEQHLIPVFGHTGKDVRQLNTGELERGFAIDVIRHSHRSGCCRDLDQRTEGGFTLDGVSVVSRQLGSADDRVATGVVNVDAGGQFQLGRIVAEERFLAVATANADVGVKTRDGRSEDAGTGGGAVEFFRQGGTATDHCGHGLGGSQCCNYP